MGKSILQGVVKDHRLPSDYKLAMNQPVGTVKFMKDFKRTLATSLIHKNYASVPLIILFGVAVPYFALQSYLRMKQTGSLPQALQPQYYLYRSNLAWYGYQHNMNANPDNHFNRIGNCWTSDPMCGLDVGPKRPWLDLKDPAKNLFKFQRDATENQHVKAMGWRGF